MIRTTAKLVYDGGDTISIPAECGTPRDDQMQGTVAEQLTELAGRVCYGPGVELLTRSGWVAIEQLPTDEEVATFNQETNQIEFQYPTDYIKQPHSGRMYRVHSSKVSLFVTPNHNLFAANRYGDDWRLVPAEQIAGTCFQIKRAAPYHGEEPSPVLMPGRTYQQKHLNERVITRAVSDILIDIQQLDAFAAFLGYFISEGTINLNEGNKTAPYIDVYQRPEHAGPMLEAIKDCGFTARTSIDARNGVMQIRIGSSTLARFLAKEVGVGCKTFRIPSFVFNWTIELRNIFLDALMYGDGTTTKNNVRIYNTASRTLADDVQRLMVCLGRPANINYSQCETCTMYRVRETKHKTTSVNKHKQQDMWIKYTGDVYCVSVPNHILVTRTDDKVVFCGNCYDSLGRGRPSFTDGDKEGYHDHILGVGHGSVLEHFNFTVRCPALIENILVLLNRPGSWFDIHTNHMDVTMNLRTLHEWVDWSDGQQDGYGKALLNLVNPLAPHIIKKQTGVSSKCLELVEPSNDNQKWITMFLAGSRGFSHELVRHGDFTAISQRSTRYVDEYRSEWVEHPLLRAYKEDGHADEVQAFENAAIITAKNAYMCLATRLEKWLNERGLDKTSARKQARGAARGFLGNALSTEVIFSANVAQWRRMIQQRASQFADAEIREVFIQAIKELQRSRYQDRFQDIQILPSPDGIGQVAHFV